MEIRIKAKDKHGKQVGEMMKYCIENYFKEFTLPDILEFRWNTRAKRKAGVCRRYIGDEKKFIIEISKEYAENFPDDVENTLVHELIHTLPDCWNHGKGFRKIMSYMNSNFDNLNISVSANNVLNNGKYKIYCENCGLVWTNVRKSRVVSNPDEYQCKECSGSISVKVEEDEKF